VTEYLVRFSPAARKNLSDSFNWGAEKWGLDRALAWLDTMEASIEKQLSRFPLACPVAPESKEFDAEVRHLILGRYRVIFTIRKGDVLVLTIRGPYPGIRNR
jgi:plasmid stabilization system protein ParE